MEKRQRQSDASMVDAIMAAKPNLKRKAKERNKERKLSINRMKN